MPPPSGEPIVAPNGDFDVDQGLIHYSSALGVLWNDLDPADRRLTVDGHALGNVITGLGQGITMHRHSTDQALAELRRIRRQLPQDSAAGQLVDKAIRRLHAPDRPAPALPDTAPPQLHTLMSDLNKIALVRRGYDAGSRVGDPVHETDMLAELTNKWLAGQVRPIAFERELRGLTAHRHEFSEGWEEIREAVRKALVDFRAWGRRNP
jgi:hypothetical protein